MPVTRGTHIKRKRRARAAAAKGQAGQMVRQLDKLIADASRPINS